MTMTKNNHHQQEHEGHDENVSTVVVACDGGDGGLYDDDDQNQGERDAPTVVALVDFDDVGLTDNNDTDNNNSNYSNNNKIKNENRPFEWLTSPESLQSLIDKHVLFLRNDNNVPQDNDGRCCNTDDNNNDNKKKISNRGGDSNNDGDSDSDCDGRRVLHIGCGSSLWGEYLIRNQYDKIHQKHQEPQQQHQQQQSCRRRRRRRRRRRHWEKVVNVDRDAVIMDQMEQRWTNIVSKSNKDYQNRYHNASETMVNDNLSSSSTSPPLKLQQEMMEFVTLDFATTKLPFEDGYFNVVLDKSTLDCTLCSDVSTAHMLVEIYRTLSQNDGRYILISFHDIELLVPLLRDLPGAHWTVETTTMSRRIERHEVSGNSTIGGMTCPAETPPPTSTTVSDSTISDGQKPLNVLIIRKIKSNTTPEIENDYHEANGYKLDYDEVCHHIHETNNGWFQIHNPLLTAERIDGIRQAFQSQQQQQQQRQQEQEQENEKLVLSLEDAYHVLFTDAEREHLTIEHFLEDWDAYCDTEEGTFYGVVAGSSINSSCLEGGGRRRRRDEVSFDQAIKFLEFSQ